MKGQSSLHRWFASKAYLLNGRAIINAAYVSGKSFIVPTPKNYYVFISSEKHIKEFASSANFSLHSAYDDVSLLRLYETPPRFDQLHRSSPTDTTNYGGMREKICVLPKHYSSVSYAKA